MFEFFISKLSPLGENDPKWGQAYWGEANGEELPIKFNSMNPHILSGMTITAEEKAMKKSTKGTTYWQLKKVKVVEDGDHPVNKVTEPVQASQGQAGESFNLLLAGMKQINQKLDKLLANDSALDEVHPVVEGEPVDLNEMPDGFLL